jgi:hypothetical protein
MCYASGTKTIPANAAGYFSASNWKDTVEIQNGQQVAVKKAGNYVRLLDKFNFKKWHKIIKGAEQLVKGPKPVALNSYDPIVPYSSDFDIIDGEYGTDDDDDADA